MFSVNKQTFCFIIFRWHSYSIVAECRRYFLPNVQTQDYNVIIDGQNFFDQPVKSYIRTYDKVQKIAIGQSDVYTTAS